ncbi:hypothetical protein EDB85DRAFT_1892858 [Lactarius pseudohatsudake]|nr:hypothetical protein EDB85DRAFT_1892858 [Lactarius pseudohatsudake]
MIRRRDSKAKPYGLQVPVSMVSLTLVRGACTRVPWCRGAGRSRLAHYSPVPGNWSTLRENGGWRKRRAVRPTDGPAAQDRDPASDRQIFKDHPIEGELWGKGDFREVRRDGASSDHGS